MTGGAFHFDLPTEVMFEIAERAGATTVYYWVDQVDTSYFVCGRPESSAPAAVGSKLPNNWGLYDMCGNIFQLCRDGSGWTGDLKDFVDPFTPSETGNSRRARGGGFSETSDHQDFRCSDCSISYGAEFKNRFDGFRVAVVEE